MKTTIVPAVIRGQVLAASGGYLVRGQYVIGCQRGGNWFWYDMYDRRVGGSGLESEQAVFDAVGAHVAATSPTTEDE